VLLDPLGHYAFEGETGESGRQATLAATEAGTEAGTGANPWVEERLAMFRKNYPDRDFWHVPHYIKPDAWCSKLKEHETVAVITYSPALAGRGRELRHEFRARIVKDGLASRSRESRLPLASRLQILGVPPGTHLRTLCATEFHQ
jgi:hypothetical protein